MIRNIIMRNIPPNTSLLYNIIGYDHKKNNIISSDQDLHRRFTRDRNLTKKCWPIDYI